VRLDHFFGELHEDRVFAKNCVFVHRLKIDGDEEWPRHFGVDAFSTFDAKDLGNFQELHSRVHHHLFHTGGRDLWVKFVENDMMNHEGLIGVSKVCCKHESTPGAKHYLLNRPSELSAKRRASNLARLK